MNESILKFFTEGWFNKDKLVENIEGRLFV